MYLLQSKISVLSIARIVSVLEPVDRINQSGVKSYTAMNQNTALLVSLQIVLLAGERSGGLFFRKILKKKDRVPLIGRFFLI